MRDDLNCIRYLQLLQVWEYEYIVVFKPISLEQAWSDKIDPTITYWTLEMKYYEAQKEINARRYDVDALQPSDIKIMHVIKIPIILLGCVKITSFYHRGIMLSHIILVRCFESLKYFRIYQLHSCIIYAR